MGDIPELQDQTELPPCLKLLMLQGMAQQQDLPVYLCLQLAATFDIMKPNITAGYSLLQRKTSVSVDLHIPECETVFAHDVSIS
jgi:hypothetical protein